MPVALSAAAGCTAAPSSDAPGAAAVGTASSDQVLSSAFAATMAGLAPVGWWRLGETAGSAADSSGNGHIGTYHNFLSTQRGIVGGALTPLAIVARRIDNANAYRAEIRENPGGQLDLRIVKLVAGTSTVLQTATAIGTYSLHGAGTADDDWWYVRFQLEGTSLRARAWKFGTPEPTTWTVTATDSSLTAAGNVSIRSANSGTTSLPTVAFEGFRVQSVGMTVHAFMKPTVLEFNGGNYVHWLGKGEDPQMEWGFRFYPSSDPDRPKRVSGYIWNPTACCGFSTNEGAGAYFQDPALAAGTWYEVVVVYDPGDDLDTQAGVTIYQDGQCESGTRCGGTPSPGVLYSNASFVVYPLNGTSPLRIGTRDCGSFFTGGLDEVAVFDRRLTAAEISDLHTQSQ